MLCNIVYFLTVGWNVISTVLHCYSPPPQVQRWGSGQIFSDSPGCLAVGLREKGNKQGGIRGQAFILFFGGKTLGHTISKAVSLFSSAAHYMATSKGLWPQRGPEGSSRSKLPDGATLAYQYEKAQHPTPLSHPFCTSAFEFKGTWKGQGNWLQALMAGEAFYHSTLSDHGE